MQKTVVPREKMTVCSVTEQTDKTGFENDRLVCNRAKMSGQQDKSFSHYSGAGRGISISESTVYNSDQLPELTSIRARV